MSAQPIKIAVLAMGGEGGGVLADWIVDLGEHSGYVAQTTSVPGVAQRTGATIYYVELFPVQAAQASGGAPVLALMPMPGDVDIVLASELMEAGRAVQRGLVTPDRTTLISSTHRVFSIAEKSAMGDGRVDSQELLAHAERAARHFVRFDMALTAQETGSVISAVLFGALAATGTLPFARADFEATITRGGVGVKPSLKAFDAAFEKARRPPESPLAATVAAPDGPAHGMGATGALPGGVTALADARDAATTPAHAPRDRRVAELLARVESGFATRLQPLLREGVRRMLDYQDVAYANTFLDRMARVVRLPDDTDGELAATVARHLALWMSYEDTIRVADLKTRDSRFARVRGEVGVADGQLLAIKEYMHPRLEEICETLPAPIGRWLGRPNWANGLVRRMTQRGRIIHTSSLSGYLMLTSVAAMRRWRRSTLRFLAEDARIEDWLNRIEATARRNPALAIEVARCQNLVKGYSDTHARGLQNYATVMGALSRSGDALPPATLRELRDAALADEHGKALQACLQRHALA